MASKFLDSIGLGSLDIGYLFAALFGIVLVLLIIVIVLISKLSKLSNKYNTFMEGKNGKSLEKELGQIFEDNRNFKQYVEQSKRDIRRINKNLELTFQKAGLNKYDAFREMGGKLSYSLALLNDNNDGFILNSVHSSEGCYSYAKVITKGECNMDLSAEEKKALDMALGIK